MDEFDATVRYAVGGANGLSWHASIGPSRVAVHLPPDRWGWNCREESPFWIAVEFSQGLLGGPISDEQIDAFCFYARDEVRPAWPDLPHVLKMHSELPPGVRDGKSDPYPTSSAEGEVFKAKIRKRLGW